MKKTKKCLSLLISVIMVVSLAACAGNPSSSSESKDETKAADASGLKIAIITSSGVDDGSFNENCYDGIAKFVDENSDASVNAIKEPDLSKSIQAVEDTIADYEVLVLPGFNYAACADIATANPDKSIILVDSAPTDSEGNEVVVENVYSMTFSEQEPGFLAGVAAALETKTGKVAIVNGVAYPSNVNYQYGFESGVNYAVKHLGATAECVEIASYSGTDVTGANVGGNYVGAFDDVETGKILGNALIDMGVDIIYVAAGSSGNGTFTAAKEAGDVYCIGCDVDQFDDGVNGDSNIILTSSLKIMDTNVYKQLNLIKDGNFKGVNDVLGAAQDSIGIVTEEGRQQLSDDTISALNDVYELIKKGDISPASNFNGYLPDDFPGLN